MPANFSILFTAICRYGASYLGAFGCNAVSYLCRMLSSAIIGNTSMYCPHVWCMGEGSSSCPYSTRHVSEGGCSEEWACW